MITLRYLPASGKVLQEMGFIAGMMKSKKVDLGNVDVCSVRESDCLKNLKLRS